VSRPTTIVEAPPAAAAPIRSARSTRPGPNSCRIPEEPKSILLYNPFFPKKRYSSSVGAPVLETYKAADPGGRRAEEYHLFLATVLVDAGDPRIGCHAVTGDQEEVCRLRRVDHLVSEGPLEHRH